MKAASAATSGAFRDSTHPSCGPHAENPIPTLYYCDTFGGQSMYHGERARPGGTSWSSTTPEATCLARPPSSSSTHRIPRSQPRTRIRGMISLGLQNNVCYSLVGLRPSPALSQCQTRTPPLRLGSSSIPLPPRHTSV